MALFSTEGLQFIIRWIHFLAGVTWIGVLYYFNFIQGAFFAETDANTKSAVVQKLVPRALWWFRWGAMVTFLSGVLMIMMNWGAGGIEVFSTSWGVAILTGALMGTYMWANVWFVIWPAQQVVIRSAEQVAQGGQAIPEAAALGARAALASRTNTLFSFPMLFMMGAARHLPFEIGIDANLMLTGVVVGGVITLIELNALKGKMGPMKSVKGVIHCGIALTLVLYVLLEVLT